MKFTNTVFAAFLTSALVAVTGCTTEAEVATEAAVDPSIADIAENADEVDPKYSVEGGSCTTPFGGYRGSAWGYSGCSKRPPSPYSGPTCFGAAPTATECNKWCRYTCFYKAGGSLQTSKVGTTDAWRCNCI